MPSPNFLIIGDIKAGSTSLYHYLKQHPDIYMPSEVKELRYFAYDKENSYHIRSKSFVIKNYREYLEYFDKCRNEKAIGEASPNYLRSPIAATRISEKIPDVKLIACLRNPADRLNSLYMMHFRSGYTKEAFDARLFSENAAWIKANFYWSDLKRYFDIFDETQIKIILFHDLATRTKGTVKNLYDFLNVDSSFVPEFAVKNKGGMPRHRYQHAVMKSTVAHLKKYINPSPRVRQIWENMKSKTLKENKIDLQTKKKILEICKEDILRTQELIKRDLSMWFKL